MTKALYRNRPDYTTTIYYHNGTTETLKHCGRCMSIIPRKTCEHCAVQDVKEDEHKEKFKAFLASKEGG